MADALITILTAPKSFVDPHTRLIQRNALRSWQALGGAVDVIVLGDDEGVRENAEMLGARHVPGVACNEKGTPLISSMLETARQTSVTPILAIVNADIILFDDFVHAVKQVSARMKAFLLVGQRWDMDIQTELVGADAFRDLAGRVKSSARLHPPAGSDYFVFPRACYQSIPDFAIGRAGWDNWFIFKSRFAGWPVVDGTQAVTIVHQDHDYRHLPGGLPHYRLPETKQNVAMGGGEHTIFTLSDAQYQIRDEKIVRKKLTLKRFLRAIEVFPMVALRSHHLGRLFFFAFHPRKGYAALRAWLAHLLKKKV